MGPNARASPGGFAMYYAHAKAAALNRFPTIGWLLRSWRFHRTGGRELPFLSDVLLPALPKTLVCIDIGASIGTYTRLFHKHAELTIALEPNPESYEWLRRIKARRIVWLHNAAGEEGGLVDLAVPVDRRGKTVPSLSSVAGRVKASLHQEGLPFLTVPVQQLPIDDLDGLISPCDPESVFVKIDVEGYERSSLMGMTELLRRHHPILMIEIEKRHDPDHRRTFELLRHHGYESFTLRNGALAASDEQSVEDAYRLLQGSESGGGRLADPRLASEADDEYVHNFFFLTKERRRGLGL